MRSSHCTSLLSLTLDNGGMSAVTMQNAGGRLLIRKVLDVDLSLDPRKDDPELVGREIRNALSAGGIREKRCLIGLPLDWAFTLRAELPQLSEADTRTYIALQAERGFPFPPEDLMLADSRLTTPTGEVHALVAAVPKTHLGALEKALRAAGLRPIGITFGVAPLIHGRERAHKGSIVLAVGRNGVDLLIAAGGGVVTLRNLEEVIEVARGGKVIDTDLVARQLRISVGQIPNGLRESVKEIRVFGPSESVASLVKDLREPIADLGMTIGAGEMDFGIPVVENPESAKAVSICPIAATAGARRMVDDSVEFDFLAPRRSRFGRWTGRVSSRGARVPAVTAVLFLVLFGGAFLVQQFRLSRLESKWADVGPKATELETLQEKLRKFRPWYDDSVQSLVIMRALTEAFPADGTVWARNLTIKDSTEVTCKGYSRDKQEFLDMLGRLRGKDGVENLLFQQLRGDTPSEFSLSFTWQRGKVDGN